MTEPLITWQGPVLPEWTDYNGHLRDAYYLLIFSYATDGFMGQIGLDEAGRAASGCSLFTLECHLNFLHEVKQSETVEVRTRVLGYDLKRVHLYHSLHRLGEPTELAASEQMLLHVRLAGVKAASAPFSEQAKGSLHTMHAKEAAQPPPHWVGRRIALGAARKPGE